MNRIVSILLIFISNSLFSQNNVKNKCLFDSIVGTINVPSNDVVLKKKNSKESFGLKSSTIYFIPVVVHVVYKNNTENISDAQIQSQIDVLNEDFRKRNSDTTIVEQGFSIADTRIEFVLAKRTPGGQSTNGILRYTTNIDNIGNSNQYFQVAPIWDRDDYLNIWVCDIGNNVAGFAYPPGSLADRDGVVIDYTNFGDRGSVIAPYDLGRTATHEVGHWLDLIHPWGSNPNCTSDDGINDTPLQSTIYSGCPVAPRFSCSTKDMLSNFMGYVNDACMANFTEDQKTRMRDALEQLRTSILTSKGALAIGLSEKILEKNTKLYPNPSNGQTTLQLEERNIGKEVAITVYNINGQSLENSLMVYEGGVRLNFNYPKGIYFLKVSTEDGVIIKKLILNKSN